MGSAYLMGKQIFNRTKKIFGILLVVLFVASMTAVTVNAKSSGGGKIVDVGMKNSAFTPMSVKITEGDTIRWTNMDSINHAVEGSIFKSGTLSKGQSYEFLFTKPGIYNYKCLAHPNMKGTVTVVAKK